MMMTAMTMMMMLMMLMIMVVVVMMMMVMVMIMIGCVVHSCLRIATRYLSAGPGVPAQAPHTDVPPLCVLADNGGIHSVVPGRAFKISVDAPGIPAMRRGEATYGLNVQVPLVDVTEVGR